MRTNDREFSQNRVTDNSEPTARRHFRPAPKAALICGLALASVAAPALADDSIGGAKTVVNLVTGDLSTGDKVNLVQGDDVFKDEGVRTDADSSARIVLRDNTNMLLGPSSAIKLDRFVYSGPSQPGAIAVNLVKGALRFATGDADKKAYVISTPTAALGVRGTVLKIVSDSVNTFVQLDEGGSLVCTLRAPKRHCLNLTEPGQTVEVTATGIRWNAGAGASVSAVIDAIPDAPPGSPPGQTGEHADLTPTVTPVTVTTTPPSKPCGDGRDSRSNFGRDGDNGKPNNGAPANGGFGGFGGFSKPSNGAPANGGWSGTNGLSGKSGLGGPKS